MRSRSRVYQHGAGGRRVMTCCLGKCATRVQRMEEKHRQVLQRNRVRLVTALQVADIWEPLLEKGLFSADMIEEIQRAGTRRDQARQLVRDVETRGRDAFHLFLLCLRETGQSDLADLLQGNGGTMEVRKPTAPSPTPSPKRPQGTIQPPKVVDSDADYPMLFNPCGYCLIVNNMAFSKASGLSYRTGSDIDREKLERRLRSYRFEVTVKNNLKAAELHEELQQLASRDHTERDCCLVVILSHGCETRHTRFPGGVYGTDGGRIPVEQIIHYFNGSNCPGLRGKPKLFFIQACAGEEQDKGCVVDLGDSEDLPSGSITHSLQTDATPLQPDKDDTDEMDAVARLPTPGDILVSYSTFPGYVSWREKLKGSWYVETLDDVLDQFARTEDLQSMLVKVADRVSAKGTYKQIPGVFNFLRKRFLFRTD